MRIANVQFSILFSIIAGSLWGNGLRIQSLFMSSYLTRITESFEIKSFHITEKYRPLIKIRKQGLDD